MNDAQRLADTLLETEQWDKLHAGLEQVHKQTQDATGLWQRTKQSIQHHHPDRPDLQSQVANLDTQYQERNRLLQHARYATAYRRSLAHAGLTVDDVTHKYYGWVPGRGRCITHVQTKEGKYVRLPHAVPISEALTISRRLLETQDRVVNMKPPPRLVRLKPPTRWSYLLGHILPRMRERIPKTMPGATKDAIKQRIEEISEHYGWFNDQTIPVYTPMTEWQMPLPYGYRLLGVGDEPRSFTEGTIVQPIVDNPFMEDVHYSHWRTEYPEGRPKELPPIPTKKKLVNVRKR